MCVTGLKISLNTNIISTASQKVMVGAVAHTRGSRLFQASIKSQPKRQAKPKEIASEMSIVKIQMKMATPVEWSSNE